ncbi:MAG: choice-of-anchor Q domain-containing protein [Armatimonadota bacterium]
MNSIIADNTAGLNNEGDGFSPFRYNCVWGNEAYNYNGMDAPTGSEGNISVDPQVVAGHLLLGSPCIDAGDDTAVTTQEDIDGETRIGGVHEDIGADEFRAPIIQGTLYPQGYGGNPSAWVVSADLRDASGSSVTRRLWLDPDGGFVVAPVDAGTRWLSVQPPRFLRRTVPAEVSTGSVLGLEIDLINGDIGGGNEVTLFDLGRLVAAFSSMPGDSNWNPYADLDGDEEVTLFGFGILVSSFGAIGDD